MSDEFEKMISQLQAVDVAPDLDVKFNTLTAAREKIEKTFQENLDLGRPTVEPLRKEGGKQQAVRIKEMSKKVMKKIFLGTSGLVTAGLAVFLIVPIQEFQNSGIGKDTTVSNGNFGNNHSAILSESEGLLASNPLRKISDHVTGGAPNPAPVATDRATAIQKTQSFVARPTVMMQSAPESLHVMPSPVPYPSHPVSDVVLPEEPNNDQFSKVEESQVKLVADEPVSTFSIDVDTASYATLRSYLMGGRIPAGDAVRIEEMINYFSYGYQPPVNGTGPFSVSVSNFQSPWNEGTELVRIGLQGVMPEVDERPPLDLVFLVDTSGSMRAPNKLGLLKQSLKMMLPEMRPGDRIGIVTYAGSAGVKLQMTDATDRAAIELALDELSAGGSTAGAAGLEAAYGLLSKDDDRLGRVILATDGDFNVGMSSTEEMKEYIEDKRDSGAYLSVLGFGRGNYNDALMQTLAQNGNGQAAYIDTLSEAQKVLVDQLSGTLFTIAGDVKVQVEFNPTVVSEYRLIGYETRALEREDFKNDKVDAGDIGAGHQVTALYEVTPVGSSSGLYEPLRYQEKSSEDGDTSELGFLRLRYKNPGDTVSQLIETPISRAQEEMTPDDAFVTAIAGWGQHLKGGRYIGDWSMSDAQALAREGMGEDPYGYRSEAARLMKIYTSLSR